MWRIFGIVFFHDKEHFVDNEERRFCREAIISFLMEKGIGLYDIASAIRRTKNTASDKDLEVVEVTDIKALLREVPTCVSVVTTGQKATEVLAACFGISSPKVGGAVLFTFEGREMRHFRMPSSSRAYPLKIEKKAEYYERMFSVLNF